MTAKYITDAEIDQYGAPVRIWHVDATYRPHSSSIRAMLTWKDGDEQHVGFSDKLDALDAQTDLVAWVNGRFLPQAKNHARVRQSGPPGKFYFADDKYVGTAEQIEPLKFRLVCWERTTNTNHKQEA